MTHQEIFFGENRLVSCIKQYSKLTPSILIKHIHHQISQFTQNKHLGDDLTCVVLKQNQDPSVCAQTAYINISDSTPPNLPGSIKIKSALSELQKVRQFVIDYCQSIDIGRDSKIFIWQLETAIIELISNVIKYAYLCEDQHDIVIRANTDDKNVTIIVNHWGNPFPQPTCVPKPPEGEYPEGGYGLFIIDNFIDQCVYLKDDDAMNSIVVVKQKR
ncbi:MAG: anti-sigma B factor [Candidatus Magnetoglobus multicellularis str. Araruama]|uniref:Anti-sigma B factor n=1 Tax=Candidatus Magnetoglobus multicellularis str. Araruama TaxID=890399 RepID=A0A1V1PGH1_9BACT|nr:MAG: anti-sigma B factor [Candidatus Magnetoglobus multicellularis str. Araruama]